MPSDRKTSQQTCYETYHRQRPVLHAAEASSTAVMESSDFCRLCKINMKVAGVYGHSTDLFSKQKKPLSIVERLKGIGLTVVKERGKSDRVCSRCVTILSHLEHDLPHYRRWEAENGRATSWLSQDSGLPNKIWYSPPLINSSASEPSCAAEIPRLFASRTWSSISATNGDTTATIGFELSSILLATSGARW